MMEVITIQSLDHLIDIGSDILDIQNSEDPIKATVKYDGVSIENELLKEHLMFENDSEGDYTYIVYGNKKVYYDKDEADYFWYDNNNKKYIYDSKTRKIC